MTDATPLDTKAIQSLGESLADLPDASATPTQRDVVALLASDIRRARAKGYTLKHIAEHLRQRGFAINYHTLRDALPRQKKSRSGKKKPRAAASSDDARADRDGLGTGRDGARMRAVAPPDEPGRVAIPPGAFARRPDLKDL